ncbi:hypothetical protein [Nostoc sp.]|uniref:hypothetical protein n=1 Tax=Nostoc sp. TaxID=1180 RepID=UPI002FF4FF05
MNQQDFFEQGKEYYSGSAQCDRLRWAERHRKHDLLQLFIVLSISALIPAV